MLVRYFQKFVSPLALVRYSATAIFSVVHWQRCHQSATAIFSIGAMNIYVRHGNYSINFQGQYEVARKLKGPF